ncbi:hypothetical protein M422DRAFT_267528 [Sphaerobolus stellatus SS14]|uniref:Uncharacterized protein n=1 Tax=Sphaerobolus stellatus (strain SS14) TaxID=990650 RepID=A0A0C9UZZ1_SPHS4|nr:hypothetical protein M422DRAFT_267528 [Sphaerobolus stellatus SS14]
MATDLKLKEDFKFGLRWSVTERLEGTRWTCLHTISKLSARAGIEAQAVGRVFYELEVAAQKFVELASFLKVAQLPPMQKDHALLCRAPIAMLLTQIDRMLSEVDTHTKPTPRTDPLPKSHPDPSSMASTKRARLSSPPPNPLPHRQKRVRRDSNRTAYISQN